jgi:hypothetical protein
MGYWVSELWVKEDSTVVAGAGGPSSGTPSKLCLPRTYVTVGQLYYTLWGGAAYSNLTRTAKIFPLGYVQNQKNKLYVNYYFLLLERQ